MGGDSTFNGLKLGARLGGLSGNAVAEIVQVVQAKIHFGHRTWFVGLCAPNPLGMKHGDFGHIVCYDRRWNVRGRWRSGQEGHADPTALGAGFTLIELLVVLAILGLLAAIAVPQVLKYLGRAKEDVVNVQIQALETKSRLVRSRSRTLSDRPGGPERAGTKARRHRSMERTLCRQSHQPGRSLGPALRLSAIRSSGELSALLARA